ncbi:MAG TPA: HD domain-containing protein [Vicinamibacterales bacterium]|nr:HD domain-containing protein [Vicinamibacterales bacterium]
MSSEPRFAQTDPRGDARAARAARLEAARGELADASGRGEGGRHAMRQYSHRMDALIQQLYADAGSATQSVAVFALGGYGRRELCLHSDVDLLILFAGVIGRDDERFLHAFLNPLWDLGLTIGHHVREVSEGAGLEADNSEFLLALTDARPVVGDATLLDQFLEASDLAATNARTLEALKGLISERHAKFNDTLYQLEPDVKESPGGLRDLFGAQTIAKLTDPALLSNGGAGSRALEDAEEFLLRVRSVLHLEAGRHHNILGHEVQERVAERLGYAGATPSQRVERFMGDYFRHAKAIDRSLRFALKAAPSPIGRNLVRGADGIRFIDTREAAERPETWLSLFQAAIDGGCPVADDALACVGQNAGRFAAETFLPSKAHRERLLNFLKPRRGLYARLSEMHDCGLLGQMFPEFKAISCRVVRDFYHKYTVDEHTLLTIKNLERLTDKSSRERERFARLLGELQAPELLVLALLYHDVGKWTDEDHTLESARLAKQMFARLDLDADQRAEVDFLVREHIKMSLIAFRRDTEDPEIVRQFAQFVGVEERLKMLCLMTIADVEAVSRETLTPWKEELLWRLYVDTYNHLTLTYGDEVIDREQSLHSVLLDHRPDDVSPDEIAAFLEGLPRRYLQLFSSEAVYQHVRLSRQLAPDTIKAWVSRVDSGWELTVLTHDRPFLFSNISGVLSSYGMDILRGFAFTKPTGLIVDMFHFTDDERFLELNPEGEAELLKTLTNVVLGHAEIAPRLRGREQGAFRKKLPGFAPVVHCDNESSRRYTIVEIVAEDALGLLYRVSRAMSELGCDVDLVLIGTEGRRAIDVFHLTRDGVKLTPDQQQEITGNLQRVLEGRS